MKTAVIIGISGQDGYYLTELLLKYKYKVIGLTRDIQKAKNSLSNLSLMNVVLLQWDLKDEDFFEDVLRKYKVDQIYNFAAFTSGTGMFDNVIEMAEINGFAITKILEAIRKVDCKIRFCQASSSYVFGYANQSPQNEKSLVSPRNPYAAAKSYADSMVKIYRHQYNIFACSAILYNHESPLRSLDFVSRKVTCTASKIKLGLENKLVIGNLNSKRDWGYASDYVKAMYLMLQSSNADDYVIATGELHSVKDLCEIAFNYLDLDYRDFVFEDDTYFRPNEPLEFFGDAGKAKKILNWQPSIDFKQLIHIMVDNDLKLLKIG